MIIKGGPRAAGKELGLHLLRADTNEKVEAVDFQGVVARDVKGAVREMEAVASGSRSTKPLYHVSVSPAISERLTTEQWYEAADVLGEALGLAGHQRFVVLHIKNGRQHAHMVWNRADPETLKVAHHSHNYRTHEEVARELERRFGLVRTQGVHAETEKGKGTGERDKRPNTRDSQQEVRTGWRKADAKAAILHAWTRSDDGRSFSDRLDELGYRLAQGDTRDVIVVDPAGGIHSVRSGVKGLRVDALRARLADLDIAALPTLTAARKSLAAEPLPTQAAEKTVTEKPMSARPAVAPHRPHLDAPKLVPVPPTWARSAALLTKASSSPAPTPAPKPQRPTADLSSLARREISALEARQIVNAQAETEAQAQHHDAQRRDLAEWHDKRLANLEATADAEIGQLNSFLSRAGSLIEGDSWRRKLALAVAKRQRGMEEERQRQEKKRDELARAQQLEREAAEAKRKEREALERKALEKRLASRSALPSRTNDLGREPD